MRTRVKGTSLLTKPSSTLSPPSTSTASESFIRGARPTMASFFKFPRFRTVAAVTTAPVAVLGAQLWYLRFKFKLPPDACGPTAGIVAAPAGASSSSRQRNIIFLGDSIVTGVGCSREASERDGPVLPVRVASILAKQLGASVSWKCVGETGTDVRMLQTRMLPKLRDEVQRVDGAGQRVDAVVVMTGLNDIKECFLFAQPSLHPWFFGRALASLLTEVCEIAGAGCACIVPGHPIEVTPRFNQFWPMSWVVPAIVRMWEDQKRVAAETAQAQEDTTIASSTARCLIEYLQPPPHMVAMMWGQDYFASDGMHPNDNGYALWADVIAARLLVEWGAKAEK